MRSNANPDRRTKSRFAIRRELRYKLLEDGKIVGSGAGYTIDIGSGGVAFVADRPLAPGAFLEISISWPVLLAESCPMRLNVFGRLLRINPDRAVCSVEKYEFRTQARTAGAAPTVRCDSMLQRWAENVQRSAVRSNIAGA